ncbi:MAG: hypothetical protein WB819_02290, partial [Terriglobia bacterium]
LAGAENALKVPGVGTAKNWNHRYVSILSGRWNNPLSCHPERSEGSALFIFSKIQQMLRCAQHDG